MLEVSCVAFSPKSCVCLLWSCIPAPGEVGSPGLLDFGFLARPSSFAISWKTLDERTAHCYVCTFFSCSCVLGVTGPTLSKIPARGPFCDVGSGTQSWGTVRSFRPFFATSHANFNELEYKRGTRQERRAFHGCKKRRFFVAGISNAAILFSFIYWCLYIRVVRRTPSVLLRTLTPVPGISP